MPLVHPFTICLARAKSSPVVLPSVPCDKLASFAGLVVAIGAVQKVNWELLQPEACSTTHIREASSCHLPITLSHPPITDTQPKHCNNAWQIYVEGLRVLGARCTWWLLLAPSPFSSSSPASLSYFWRAVH